MEESYSSKFICPFCGKKFSMDTGVFLQSPSIKCGKCGADIISGKEGVQRQIELLVKSSELLSAAKLHRNATGDSLEKTKDYVFKIAQMYGVKLQNKAGLITIIIFCLIFGMIISAILFEVYSPAVFFISEDIFGIDTRKENFSTFILGGLFYGLMIYILINFRRFFRKIKDG